MSDVISNPSHYTKGRKYEPRKVIEDWDLDFYLGNALKYISRAGRKNNTIEDLQKAKQYLDFEIEKLENNKYDKLYNSLKIYTILPKTTNPIPITPSYKTKDAISITEETKMSNYMFDYALKDIDTAIQRCRALPDSREKSIAITKLEEAQMWVKQAMEKTNE